LTVHFYLLVDFNSGDRGSEAALFVRVRWDLPANPEKGGFFEGYSAVGNTIRLSPKNGNVKP
jgi:hypothetical protein